MDSKGLAELYLLRKREILQAIMDVGDLTEISYNLLRLGLLRGLAGYASFSSETLAIIDASNAGLLMSMELYSPAFYSSGAKSNR